MTYTINTALTISLNAEKHNFAHQFALEQDTIQKGKQVYLNTLAILAVQSFLEWLGIETNLEVGDSWNPAIRCFHDVADLVIINLGKVECRPVLSGETVISLPIEVTEDRIAYIGVEFQEQLNEVQLLGFYPAIDPQTHSELIEINSLQPIENFIDYIDRLESAHLFLQSDDEVAIKARERLVNQPISEIIAQLERIYHYDRYEWRYAGGECLAHYALVELDSAFRRDTPIINKENIDDSQQTDLQNLAEELLEKLDEIWGSSD